MPIIAAHHAWKDPDHQPDPAWPATCMVQWGGAGIVLSSKPGGSRITAFFEAFPEEGGFIRGEGKTIAEAEAKALARYRKEVDCAHSWSRSGYTNGGGVCRHCKAFRLVFVPIVTLGTWKEPLSASMLDLIAEGHMRPDPADPAATLRARKAWLKARRMGIALPDLASAPPEPKGFQGDAYADLCRKAVRDWLRQHPDAIAGSGQGAGLAGLFEGLHRGSLRHLLEEEDGHAEEADRCDKSGMRTDPAEALVRKSGPDPCPPSSRDRGTPPEDHRHVRALAGTCQTGPGRPSGGAMTRSRIRTLLQDIRRGSGTLPHVGAHPGTPILIGLTLLGGIAGMSGAPEGSAALSGILGALVMAIPVGVIYAVGCVGRARTSDALMERRSQPMTREMSP